MGVLGRGAHGGETVQGILEAQQVNEFAGSGVTLGEIRGRLQKGGRANLGRT